MNIRFPEIIETIAASSDELLGGRSLVRLDAFFGGCCHAWGRLQVSGLDRVAIDIAHLRKQLAARSGIQSQHSAFSMAAVVSRNDEEAFELLRNECADIWPSSAMSMPVKQEMPAISSGKCSVLQMLNEVRARPAIFLGLHSITRLRAYADGYVYAAKSVGVDAEQDFQLRTFEQWLHERFGLKSRFRWERLVAFFRSFDEAQGLAFFFELLDEYLGTVSGDKTQ